MAARRPAEMRQPLSHRNVLWKSSLVNDLVRNIPYFVRAVLRSQSGLRTVNIAEQALEEDFSAEEN